MWPNKVAVPQKWLNEWMYCVSSIRSVTQEISGTEEKRSTEEESEGGTWRSAPHGKNSFPRTSQHLPESTLLFWLVLSKTGYMYLNGSGPLMEEKEKEKVSWANKFRHYRWLEGFSWDVGTDQKHISASEHMRPGCGLQFNARRVTHHSASKVPHNVPFPARPFQVIFLPGG